MGKEQIYRLDGSLERVTWKGKRRDFLLVFLIFQFTVIGFHCFISARIAAEDKTPFSEEVLFPGWLVLSYVIVLFVYGTPVFLFKKYLPKSIEINRTTNSIYIHRWSKKAKILRLDLPYTTFGFYTKGWYCVLEINGIFHNSKGDEIQKSVYKVIAPRLGLVWDQLRIQEMIVVLQKEGVEQVDIQELPLWELING